MKHTTKITQPCPDDLCIGEARIQSFTATEMAEQMRDLDDTELAAIGWRFLTDHTDWMLFDDYQEEVDLTIGLSGFKRIREEQTELFAESDNDPVDEATARGW